ncbi:hypothetical protein GUJ93_ZPchr0003g16741 [Zizania palustris]|uniref:Uncharacterized protein n=1 Tax=Zizania palustris TaxID=103762 RepID=A0A8J5S3G7_ZIZPA|nr:hypothetical protein GUJ93_ZPchr0003g16741 [Zizania palustris]
MGHYCYRSVFLVSSKANTSALLLATGGVTRASAITTVPAIAHALRIQCGACDDPNVAVVNGEVWIKHVRDDMAGRPAFALVNKATGDALKHSFSYSYPVKLL